MSRLVVIALQRLVRRAFMLVLIMAVLLVGRWALGGVRELRAARADLAALQHQRDALAAEPARVARWIDDVLRGTANSTNGPLTRCIEARERRQTQRTALRAQHPVAVLLPGSESFLELRHRRGPWTGS